MSIVSCLALLYVLQQLSVLIHFMQPSSQGSAFRITEGCIDFA